MSISNFEKMYERCETLVPFTIRLSDFTSEEATEIFALDSKFWMFSPEDFQERIGADPDCEVRVTCGLPEEVSDEELAAMSKILDKAKRVA